jgi:hypothetical protein
MTRRLISTIAATFAVSANAQFPDDVYDGPWYGTMTCSEILVTGNVQRAQGFTDRITIVIASKNGQAHYDTSTVVSHYTLTIGQDSSVSLQGSGSRKENTNLAWSIAAKGKVTGDQLYAVGPMFGGDGKTLVRARCEFSVQNVAVLARLDAAKARTAAAAAAVSAQPVASEPMKKAAAAVPAVTEVARSTPPPAAIGATKERPARVAAIANVEQPSERSKSSYTKVTGNPVDSVKKAGANDVWINFNPSITVQERQFCRLIENYRAEARAAELSKNQIKVNETVKAFSQAINALLPDGQFQGWVMRSISVAQANDGSADVIFELPCNVYVGSNTCDPNPKNFYGTVPENSRIYSELAKMTVNDFALVSGRFVYTDDKAFDRTRSVTSYGYSKTAAHCKSKVMASNADFFGTSISVLSTIK